MKCQHNTQRRFGDYMWCAFCGGLKVGSEWLLPAAPPRPEGEPSAESVITHLQRIARNTSENYREDAAQALALLGAET